MAERRQVSVLFVDLVGFTTFADGRDPEQVRNVQSRYFELASDAVTRHGGSVEKFIGDAVMAVWGTPVAHEDDAQRAVRAALEVVEAVGQLRHNLRVRGGIVTGQAATRVGATNQGMVAGDMVNTASRLQASAEPGEVLADHNTIQAASGAIAFEAVEDRELKGKSGPMRAWRALRVRPARASEAMVEPPFVGRAEELRRMKELLHGAGRDRRIRLVSITGPAGIGKSRLIEELGTYADGIADDIWWHTGRSPSYGEGLTFWALGEMVRRRAGLAEDDAADATAARISATVEEFVTEPAEREWIGSALLALLGASGEPTEGESLFPAWRTFFERIAERGTTVLVFEDLQWADSGTLDFVDHLLDWSRSQPIVIVTLGRPELLESRPGWGTARSNSSSMALHPLDDDAMRELLHGLLPGLPAAHVETIVERAAGMPLYAVEIVRALLADGRIERAGDAYEPIGDLADMPIPASLRSLISSRLDALDADDRALLQHGSVLGQAFTTDALSSVTARDAADLEPRLRALVRRELLEIEADPRSPERGQYRFVQSLIREVAYDTLAMAERRSRHLAAARHLEASEADEVAGALASHYLAAFHASEEGPEADAVAAQARISLKAAAERAASLGAHEQAVQNLEHALELTQDPRERAELLQRAAVDASAAGLQMGISFAEQAVSTYREIEDGTGAITATALLGDLLLDGGRVREASEVLSAAIAALDGDSEPGWDEPEAALLAAQSRAEMRHSRDDAAIALADRALVIAERQNLERVAASALVNKGSALSQQGRRREGGSLLEGGIRLAERHGLTHIELRARMNLANTLADDEPIRSFETFRQTVELAERVGDRDVYISSVAGYSDSAVALGTAETWREAEESIQKAVELGADEIDLVYLTGTRLFIALSRGADVADEMASLDGLVAASSDPRARHIPFLARAWHACLEQRWVDAAAAASQAIEIEPWTAIWLGTCVAKAALHTRDLTALEAARTAANSVPLSGRWSSATRIALASALAAANDKPDEAYAGYADALQQLRSAGVEWDAAQVTIDANLALPGDSRVRAWEPAASAVFEAVGATAWIGALKDALDTKRSPSSPEGVEAGSPAAARDTR